MHDDNFNSTRNVFSAMLDDALHSADMQIWFYGIFELQLKLISMIKCESFHFLDDENLGRVSWKLLKWKSFVSWRESSMKNWTSRDLQRIANANHPFCANLGYCATHDLSLSVGCRAVANPKLISCVKRDYDVSFFHHSCDAERSGKCNKF